MSTITVTAGLQPRQARTVRPARATPSTRPAPAAPLRLTRRGRLLVTVLTFLALVTVGVVAAGGVPAVAGAEPGTAATAQRVTVRPGETLWVIAERVAPGVDPRDTVAEIMDLNALETSAVEAGQALVVPR